MSGLFRMDNYGEAVLNMAVKHIIRLFRYRPGRELIGRIEDTFKACGIRNKEDKIPMLCHYHKKGNEITTYWRLPPGTNFKQVLDKAEFFDDSIGAYCSISQNKKGQFELKITLGEIPDEHNYYFNPEEYPKMILPIPIGILPGGKLLVVDLSEIPHIKSAGVTFTGKSNWLHNVVIALSILKALYPNRVELFILDMALLEFSYMKNHAVFGSTLEEALRILAFLENKMFSRLKILDTAGVEKIQEYNKLFPDDPLTYYVNIVDEYSLMIPEPGDSDEEKKIKTKIMVKVNRLAKLARKVGIHLILATQRPDKDVLPGSIKANIPGTLSLRTIDATNSRIILDTNDAAYLPNVKGRAIWRIGIEQHQVQVMKLPLKKARKIISKLPPGRIRGWKNESYQERLQPRQTNS